MQLFSGGPELGPEDNIFGVVFTTDSGQTIDMILELSSYFGLNIGVRVVEMFFERLDQNGILDLATNID